MNSMAVNPTFAAASGEAASAVSMTPRGGTPGVAGAIEIEQWRGLAALDRPGPLQDNRGKRAKEESAPCPKVHQRALFFSNEAAGR